MTARQESDLIESGRNPCTCSAPIPLANVTPAVRMAVRMRVTGSYPPLSCFEPISFRRPTEKSFSGGQIFKTLKGFDDPLREAASVVFASNRSRKKV
jgi:hypothetical protein